MEVNEHAEVTNYESKSEFRNLNLYNSALKYVAKNLFLFANTIHLIPAPNFRDVLNKAVEFKLCQNLQRQISNPDLLEKVLQNSSYWGTLHKCIQIILTKEKDFGFFLASQKVTQYSFLKNMVSNGKRNNKDVYRYVHQAIKLASFFCECGMYSCAEMIYTCIDVVDLNGNMNNEQMLIAFEVSLRMAYTSTLDCKFDDANKSVINASVLLTYLQNAQFKPNCALFYTICSMYMFSISQYDKAYNLAIQAVQELDSRLSPKVIVDTLRQACKACIIKRYFPQACVYAKEAVRLAKHWYGIKHPKYADTLSDYGFYLLSVDSVSNGVKYYQNALEIRTELFGENNIITAITHEDLAYAVYVRDYSQGNFHEARSHAEQGLRVLTTLLPNDHLLLSSSKRVQALILEEVAIDTGDEAEEKRLLNCAEELHIDSLRLARKTFGESNVQTAKHYGNLGRLYQSMKKYKDAEINHLKAIEIKENLLGAEDYEVALSIGHLASLYNYDMEKYDQAEGLYLRSIAIGRKLFGGWYSGLEYDYRGLVHLYANTGNFNQMSSFQMKLAEWKDEREDILSSRQVDVDLNFDHEPSVEQVLSSIKANANSKQPCGS